MFEIVRKGYNQKQVGEFVFKMNSIITDLRTKNAELSNEIALLNEQIKELDSKQNEKQDILIKAVENENTNKRLYDLEVEKLDELIEKWSETLNKIRDEFGHISKVEKQSIDFKNDLEKQTQKIIDFNFSKSNEKVAGDKIYHKQLLSRMSGLLNSVSLAPASNTDEDENRIEQKIVKEEKQQTQTIKESIKKEDNNYSNLLSKYLVDIDKDIEDVAFDESKILGNKEAKLAIPSFFPTPNSSGFDLKEAVNPKDSLEDIMSDFDFYNPEENLKKKKKNK